MLLKGQLYQEFHSHFPLIIFTPHRNFVKAIQTGTTHTVDSDGVSQQDGSRHSSPSITRSSSGSNRSVHSPKKKSHLFGIRQSASKHSNHSA